MRFLFEHRINFIDMVSASSAAMAFFADQYLVCIAFILCGAGISVAGRYCLNKGAS